MWHAEDAGDPSGRIIRMKSVRSGFYLHVKSEKMEDGDPVFHVDSTSEGSEWEMEVVEVEEGYGAAFMLKSVRSGFYLHVSAKSMGNGGPVFNRDSTTDGSKWQVEFVENSSSIIMLKSVRNHQYLHVPSQSI